LFSLPAGERRIPGRLYKSSALPSQETRGSGKGLRDEAGRWKDEGMARYRTWDLPINNKILSCTGNRDTSENARGNKSAATAAKGLLFRFCRGNAERTTTLTTLEGWFVPAGYISYFAIFAMVPDGRVRCIAKIISTAVSPDADDDEKDDDDDAVRGAVRQHLRPDRVDESLPREVSGGGLRSPIEDGAFRRGDGLKHAHRAGKRVPLAKKSGWRPSSPRTILSGESIEARKKPRKGLLSRQTEPFSSEKITGRLDVKSSRLLLAAGFVVLYFSSTVSSPQSLPVLHAIVSKPIIKDTINGPPIKYN
ncbi:hypothetical protein ALC62_12864, partial [Cyphomyrmex costatus]